ncbi:MAG: sigma-54-dependent Fis family transcriptional regulator [Deltaproteobacteria bacterium]|nr:sigma-54-dependent Fis family transcriptional regulator [Deltaproteobacteria bacterium]
MPGHKVLIVDDEAGVRFGLRGFLVTNGYSVEEAATCAEAEAGFRASRPDAAILDYQLPDGNALDLLPLLKKIDPTVPLLILTGHGSIDLAVRAIKEGAEHFLTKPVELPALLVMLQRMFDNQRTRRHQLAGRARDQRAVADPFLGTSPAIRELAEQARRVLASDSPVLIQGETGAGKGVLARWLHSNGPRADEAFVDLNCAGLAREFLDSELFGHEKGAFTGAVAVKPGLLEAAHRGTVFLDEIGDMELQVQPKLLKVLEEKQFRRMGSITDRHVDVRLISSTHQDLQQRIQSGAFRGDLYFRIGALPLLVPPLRLRRNDVPLLARALLTTIAADLGRRDLALSAEAESALCAYDWPGNIRELRNVLERAVLLSDHTQLTGADLRFEFAGVSRGLGPAADLTLEELERQHIQRVLADEGGHVARTAARLGIPRSSLYSRLRKFQIDVDK